MFTLGASGVMILITGVYSISSIRFVRWGRCCLNSGGIKYSLGDNVRPCVLAEGAAGSLLEVEIKSDQEPRLIIASERLNLSRMLISYPVMKLSPVPNEPLYLWNVPNWCFWGIPRLSPVCPAPLPTCLKCVAGIKLRININLQKSMRLMRWIIKYIVFVLFLKEHVSKKD